MAHKDSEPERLTPPMLFSHCQIDSVPLQKVSNTAIHLHLVARYFGVSLGSVAQLASVSVLSVPLGFWQRRVFCFFKSTAFSVTLANSTVQLGVGNCLYVLGISNTHSDQPFLPLRDGMFLMPSQKTVLRRIQKLGVESVIHCCCLGRGQGQYVACVHIPVLFV